MHENDSENLLKNTLEELAKELAPHYEGKLVIRESSEYFDPEKKRLEVNAGIEPAYHIIEERSVDFLGFLRATEEHRVLVADKRLYGNDVCVLFFNERDRLSIKKYLLPYVAAQKASRLRLFRMD